MVLDQFGAPVASPPTVTWSVERAGGGTVDSTGLYRAASIPGRRESIVASIAGAAVAGSATSHVAPNATVVGRHVFYNRSHWDGSTATVPDGPNDAAAIDWNKTALLPGQRATFSNYTSYDRGINGIMLDVTGISEFRILTADDFEFRVGNTSDPSTWALVSPAPDVTMEWAQDVDDPDRVKLVWPDNTIKNQWLRVTIKTTADTGLGSPDVFYFGNLKGETLDNTTTVQGNQVYATLAEDHSATRNAVDANPGGQAPITSIFDHNRDGFLTSDDSLVVQQNFFATLYLFQSAPA